jgi:hypothetical protein
MRLTSHQESGWLRLGLPEKKKLYMMAATWDKAAAQKARLFRV